MAKLGMTILACKLTTDSSIADMAQQTVQLRGLDLASRAGQAAARRRLLVAVHVACSAADAGENNQLVEESLVLKLPALCHLLDPIYRSHRDCGNG